MKNQLCVISILTAFALPAAAEGGYLLGDFGQSKFEIDIGDFSLSKTDTAFSFGAGYELNKTLSVELAYRDLGELKESNEDYESKISVTAIQLSLLASLPISDIVSIYGRFGVGKLKSEYKEIFFGANYSDSDSVNKTIIGFGGSFKAQENFLLRVEYSQFAEWDDTSISTLTVGGAYKF